MTRRATRGVSLLETLVVLVLIGILAALAVPNILRLIRRNRVANAAREVGALLVDARSQAVTRGYPTVVCVAGSAAVNLDGVAGNDPNRVWLARKTQPLAPGVPMDGVTAGLAFGADLALEDWRPTDGVSFTFGGGTGVPETSALQIAFDMAGTATVYSAGDCVPATARVLVPWTGAGPAIELVVGVAGDPSVTQLVRLRRDGSVELP